MTIISIGPPPFPPSPGQGGAEEAELIGERAPEIGLPTGSRLGGRPALLEDVARGEEPW
jgi:hypothetical protein